MRLVIKKKTATKLFNAARAQEINLLTNRGVNSILTRITAAYNIKTVVTAAGINLTCRILKVAVDLKCCRESRRTLPLLMMQF